MKGIHVNWTKPYFERKRLRGHGFEIMKNSTSETYELTDFQIMYTMASIVEWKQFNGPVKLYTDTVGANYYQSLGILGLYDEVDVNFLNGYATANSSANIIQAQRDYFGAHTYQRIDDPSEEFHHTNW